MNVSKSNEVVAKGKIPIVNILVQSLCAPFVHSKQLASRISVPLVLFIVIINILTLLSVIKVPSPETITALVMILFLSILFSVFVLVAISCHRVFIVGEPDYHKISWMTSRPWKFAGWILVIGIIGQLFQTIVYLIIISIFAKDTFMSNNGYFDMLFWFVIVFEAYILSRCYLVYPTTAIDKGVNLETSWLLTKGNSFRVFFLINIVPFLSYLLLFSFFQSYDSNSMFSSYPYMTVNTLAVLFIFVCIVEIATISYSYKALMKIHQ